MKKKFVVILTVSLILASGILLAFNTKHAEPVCNESNEKCCEKKENTVPGGMLWESISRQFSTSTSY